MRNGKQLYRNPENARIAGVCSGVAEYFGLETWLVRILVVTGFFLLAGPFIFVAYIAAWFILDKKTCWVKKMHQRNLFSQKVRDGQIPTVVR